MLLRYPFLPFLVLLMTVDNVQALGWFGTDLNGRPCHGLPQAYGPFDYRKAINRKKYLPIVEEYHFNKQVENLIRGMTSGVLGDIDYTLRAFPNHHRALKSVARYWLQGRENPAKLPPAECYLQRAEAFAPDDYKVHLIFGIYLHRKHKLQKARKHYLTAIKLQPKSALSHYNLGLLYVDLNELDLARKEARAAAKLGYPLKGLSHRIQRAEEKQTANAPPNNTTDRKEGEKEMKKNDTSTEKTKP